MAETRQGQASDRTERVQRISAAVEEQREALVSFLQALVREPSVTGDEGRVQALIGAQMQRDGTRVDGVGTGPERRLRPTPSTSGISRRSRDGRTSLACSAARRTGAPWFSTRTSIRSTRANQSLEPPPFSADVADGDLYGPWLVRHEGRAGRRISSRSRPCARPVTPPAVT